MNIHQRITINIICKWEAFYHSQDKSKRGKDRAWKMGINFSLESPDSPDWNPLLGSLWAQL